MSDRDSSINAAIALLRDAGFVVTRPDEEPWTTPADLARELDLQTSTLSIRLRHPLCPTYTQRRGPTGRLIALRPHKALREFLQVERINGRTLLPAA